ncbi:hypothetical protein CA223_10130 [Sphingomonas koreensis]|jgi:hypothetical protein|uniref:Uncharacterized protein n=2 Tax=Sphingomonas koreensis TaxID=93064 RepID=A0A430G712_9SPHN|nr:hypothetical protein [Sphingomonas koreensis]MDC7811223.1 hypothetical protein [Sphingomonas koreensis]RSU18070.1 hypothetical protein CA224_17250 [Sphingomonas koreensis]RSU23382.1 hypothetical protein CA222_15740 [Sphingomonas koreensis]RSU25393.1 hypothetical protein CA225_16270 [Sphingomonas koreensis]RSU38221.1 hypothetical protein BRX39_03725 [Sphingomonas koreensis]
MMLHLMLGAALLVPTIATAQTAPTAPAADAAKPAAKFNLDTPIGELLANDAAKAVLDKELPGLTQLPQLEMIKGLGLKQLQPYSDGKLTDELLAKTEASLAAIK